MPRPSKKSKARLASYVQQGKDDKKQHFAAKKQKVSPICHTSDEEDEAVHVVASAEALQFSIWLMEASTQRSRCHFNVMGGIGRMS